MVSPRPGSSERIWTGPRRRAPLARTTFYWARELVALFCLALAAGCTYTVAGDTPAAIELPRPSFQPTVEYTVAEFWFVLGGGDLATSIFDGRQLSEEIMESWEDRGYVRAPEYVVDGSFTGTADYQLTLSGSQRGDTSFTMQVINALTLSLVPYTITQHYDFEYLLEDVSRGTQYSAMVQAADKTWVEPFLILTLPWAGRGHRTTMERAGDALYDQFARQGAFTRDDGQNACEVRDILWVAMRASGLSCQERASAGTESVPSPHAGEQ